MSVNDLIDERLFAKEPQKNNIKFAKIDNLPKEIKYKLKQYNKYKELGHNKVAYLYQMLVRIAFIREWHYYNNRIFSSTINYNLGKNKYQEIFEVIVLLIWANIEFSLNEIFSLIKFKWLPKKIYKSPYTKFFIPEEEKKLRLLDRSSKIRDYILDILTYSDVKNEFHEKCLSIWAYIDFSSNSLTEPVLSDFESNLVSIRENFNKSAVKINSLKDLINFPQTNILISLNPFSDTKILTKSITKIIHHEKQRLEKNAKNRNTDLLFDKEYDTFLKYNILFYMDIYLYTKIFDITFTNEMWAKIVLGRKSLETDKRKLVVDNCRKYRENFEEIMLKGISNEDENIEFQIYVQKIQQKLYTEMVHKYISDK